MSRLGYPLRDSFQIVSGRHNFFPKGPSAPIVPHRIGEQSLEARVLVLQ